MNKKNVKIPRPVANVSNRNVGSYGNTRNVNTENTVDRDPYREGDEEEPYHLTDNENPYHLGVPRFERRGGRHRRKSRRSRRSRSRSRRRTRRYRHY